MRLVRFLWLGVLICLSLAPWMVKSRLGINGARHNRWHFAAFFLTTLVFSDTWLFDRQVPHGHGNRFLCRVRSVSSRVFRSLAAPLVAISLEALEMAVYHNRFEWRDVGVDCVGIAVAFASLATWQMLYNPKPILLRLHEVEPAGEN